MKASKLTSHDMPARRRRSERPQAEAASVTRSAEVVLDVEVDDDRLHLVLANCGDAVATDIQVEFSCALMGLGGSIDLSTLPVFTRMSVLRPGRTLRIFWDAASALVGRGDKTPAFVAAVSWSERQRGRQRAEYHHDLSVYEHWPQCVESPRQ
jgi:hypothetical protein